MRIRQLVLWLIFICLAFWWISCAPSAENATSSYGNSGGFILLGFYHGAILPFSIMGKIIGIDIGLLDRGKIDDLTYIVGYLLALYFYARIIQFLWLAFKSHRETTRNK